MLILEQSPLTLLGREVMHFVDLEEGFGHLLFHACLAEREREIALVSMRQNGVVEFTRTWNVYDGHSEVMANVLIVGVDVGVTDGVLLCLVDPRVQGRYVDVLDLLSIGWVNLVM